MRLVEINWNPTHRQLRQFGIVCLIALPFIGWCWGATLQVLGWLTLLGGALAIIGVLHPRVLRPLFAVLTIVALPIGMLLGEVAMLLIFFGLFLPLGLLFRLLRRDALQLRRDGSATSYWQPKRQPRNVAAYYRQS